jgi:MoaA/NifB/PqqE/SkfB family radical SAM enzyme
MIPAHIIKAKVIWETRKRFAKFEFLFRRKSLLPFLESSISHVSIETTNICNANCVFCAYQYQQRPTGVMSVELFRKIIDEYSDLGGGELGLTPTVGDPLVDKDIVSRIAYARSKPNIHKIGMYSNMISLDRVGLEALLHSGISTIVVSTSGFDEEMYKRVYRSNMYGQMLNNVKSFGIANNKAGRPVDFQIDMRADRPAEEVYQYADYRKVAEIVGPEKIGIKFRYDNWAGAITADQLSGSMRLRTPTRSKNEPCSELYSGPMIYWDGRVGACGCRDINASELIIGNVNADHLGAIWFGEEIRRLRSEFVTDKIRPICASCTHYNSVATILMDKSRLVDIKPAAMAADLMVH